MSCKAHGYCLAGQVFSGFFSPFAMPSNAIKQGVVVEDCVSSATAYVVGKPLGRVPQTPCLMSRAGKLKAMGAGCDFL